MAEQKYYVNAVWFDPDDYGRIVLRKYDNDGIGYTRLEAMRMCVKLTGAGKYCSVVKKGTGSDRLPKSKKGGEKKCAAKSIRKSGKQTSS